MIMDNPDALLERIQHWDMEALAQVYDTYAPAIYRYAYRRTGHPDLAQEITADTFQRLLTALKHGNGPQRHLRAWLYRVAHNLVVDSYRRQPQQGALPVDEVVLVEQSSHESNLEHKEQAARARAALQQLTPLQQQVVVLRFLEEMSLEEVANVVNRTVGAVKSLQHRALDSLRRILEVQDEVKV
jgi:RNA polymerase sigma-70 factor (ECF subfamily)